MHDNTQRVNWPLLAAATAVSLAVIACAGYAGLFPQILFGHDLFCLLDAGDKWLWGLRPNHDYCSFVGVYVSMLVAAGIKLCGLPMAVPAAGCMLALLILPAALYSAFTRLYPPVAALAVVATILAMVAPNMLQFAAHFFSLASIYDRWCYGVYIVVLWIATTPPRIGGKWLDIADGFIVGALAASCIFLKISYGMLALALCASFAVIVPRRPAYLAAALTSGVAVTILAAAAIRWDVRAFLGDMWLMSHARHGLNVGYFRHFALFLCPGIALTLVLGMAAFALMPLPAPGSSCWPLLRIPCCTAAIILCAVAIEMSNPPLGVMRENPALNIGALILASEVFLLRTTTLPSLASRLPKWLLPLLAGLLTVAPVPYLIHNTKEWIPAGIHMFLALGIASFLVSAIRMRADRLCPLLFSIAGVVFFFFLPGQAMFRNAKALFLACRDKAAHYQLPDDQVLQTGPLRGLQVAGYGGEPPLPGSYIGKIRDGLNLLSRTGNAQQTALTLDFSNPFNVIRGTRPASGAPLAWQLDFVYSAKIAPPAARVFRETDIVLIPKLFGDGEPKNLDALRGHYGSWLDVHFRKAGESSQWTLYQRADLTTPR